MYGVFDGSGDVPPPLTQSAGKSAWAEGRCVSLPTQEWKVLETGRCHLAWRLLRSATLHLQSMRTCLLSLIGFLRSD